MRRRLFLGGLLLLVSGPPASAAAPYAGPLIDAHSHLPGLQALDALVAAMDRHRIARVALLGVGGVQKDDLAWIEAAARRFPDRVIPFAPVPDPMAADAATRLDRLLATGRFKGAGEVHVHQASRKIRRAADAPPFRAVLDACARHGAPLVVHDELTPETTAELERALAHNRKAVVILAHAGGGEPRALAGLLARHENLYLDVSGMHFLRTPALATERGPLDPSWKALLTEHADRILAGIDVWAPRLYTPEMLDRLMRWTRRVLGELPPDAAERIARANAARLFRLR
ncbi:MAG: amidohydrolase family protein [Candidatus Rokuibacteriota bacterium]